MKKTIIIGTVFVLLFSLANDSALAVTETYAIIKNKTPAAITVWATYYDNQSYERKTKSIQVPGVKNNAYWMVKEFIVPVGRITLHATTSDFVNPRTGRPYSAKVNYNIPKPSHGRSASTVTWVVEAQAFTNSRVEYDEFYKSASGVSKKKDINNFSGKWLCNGRGFLEIKQSNNSLGGEISGNSVAHMWIKDYGSGTISGNIINKNKADIYIEFPNGDYVRGKGFVLKEGGDEMSGLTPILNRNGGWIRDGAHSVLCKRVK